MTRYQPLGGKIVGDGIKEKYYSNRYIYEGNTSAYIMAGDRPHVRFCRSRNMFGTLRMFLGSRPLDLFEDVRLEYTPNVVKWTVRDGEKTFDLTVTTPGDGLGFVLHAEPATEISFIFRGIAAKEPDEGFSASKNWNFSIFSADQSLLQTEFSKEWMQDNTSGTENCVCFIQNKLLGEEYGESGRVYLVSDGPSEEKDGVISGVFSNYAAASLNIPTDMETLFRTGIERGERISSMLVVDTPDEYINAAAQAAAAEMDGSWHPPKTMHGNMSWCTPYVGWMVHGQHLLGQHERAAATLDVYAGAQIKEDTKRDFERNEFGTLPSKESRFYGQGFIPEDQKFYNMQTQFFHQMISAWRYSGSEKMGAVLREALRLHLRREDECFDPDGTGLYESVINTFPTDCVYTPGGAIEETCYVYYAYKTLAELTEGEEKEACIKKAEKIKKAFIEKLWISERGYPGQFVERFGHKRLHKDSWLYSAFLPIECELTDAFMAAQCVDYPKWALKRDTNGLYWYSNWTPGIWSVRESAAGENMQLAIASFKAGKPNDAISILSNLSKDALNKAMPGELTFPVIESGVQIARAIVEGLFGYRPDYPNGRVEFEPSIPASWERASIKNSDFELHYTRTSMEVKLKRSAHIVLRMRLYADEIIRAEGALSTRLIAGIGGMILEADMGYGDHAELKLTVKGFRDFDAPEELTALPEDMSDVFDPQESAKTPYGHHIMFRKLPSGWYRELRLELGRDPAKAEIVRKQREKLPEDGNYEPLDISSYMNADVRNIFKQRYTSLRAEKGCHAEIGYDGFALWTFPFWKITPPELTMDRHGILNSPSGVPIQIVNKDKNIVFTSLWDNFPDSVTVPVSKQGKMLCLAISGSTNPNLCGMENARLIFRYADSTEELLPLVNPQNYIQLTPYPPRAADSSAECRRDVFNPYDEELLEDFTPEVLQLGENLRTLLIRWPMKQNAVLDTVTLETTSPDVVVGLMGITIVK